MTRGDRSPALGGRPQKPSARSWHCALLVVGALFAVTACDGAPDGGGNQGADSAHPDSARADFGTQAATLLLDTELHELRGQLSVKVRNTNPNDPEAPLVDRPVPHPVNPGPHTYLGVMHAEIGALRSLLGDTIPLSIEGDRGKLAFDVINGSPLLREWVDDPNATPADLDAIAVPDEKAWADERRGVLIY